MPTKLITITLLTASFLLFTGCNGQKSDSEKKRITLFNWEEYIGTETIEGFQKKTGIEVKEIHYEDEEELMGAIQSNPTQFDLIVASDDTIRELIEIKILSPLTFSQIPNFRHIKKDFLNLFFDPDQRYSVPYLWGTTGVLINTRHVDPSLKSWSILFNPAYKKRVGMLNNPFEVIAAGSKFINESINTTDPELLQKIESFLLSQQELIDGYSDVMVLKQRMIDEELWAAHIYSGEGLAAMDENPNLEYIIPSEGAPMWLDCFAVPRDSLNKKEAHAFINYILDPKINASIASELWYATANQAAESFMDQEVINSDSVYPREETLSKCEYFRDTGNSTREYHSIWNNLQRSLTP